MKPQTERLRAEYEEVIRRGQALAASLDDSGLTRRPRDGSWSAAECLDHLSATAEMYTRRIGRLLDATPASTDGRAETLSLTGRIFLYVMEPPVRRLRVKIPNDKLAPRDMPPRDELLRRYAETYAQLVALLERSDAYDRLKLRVPSPASKRVTMTLLDAFALLAAHGRRHLWQAERAVR